MKIKLFPFRNQIIFLALVFLIAGCNQDEIPDYNYFSVDGQEYKIEECVITKNFEDDTSGVFSIAFYYNLKFRDVDSSENILNIPIEENGVILSDCLFSGNIDQGFYQVIDTNWGYGYTPIKKNCFYRGNTNINDVEKEYGFRNEFTGGELTLKIDGENILSNSTVFTSQIGPRK